MEFKDDRHKRFAFEYVVDYNISKAAVRAGYSPNDPWSSGKACLMRPEVKALIDHLEAGIQEACRITAERVIAELVSLGLSNIKDYVKWDKDGVSMVPSGKLTAGQSAAIKKIKQTKTVVTGKDDYEKETTILEFELHDKLSALDKLMRHMDLYDDTLKLDAGGELAKLLEAVNGSTHGRLPSHSRD